MRSAIFVAILAAAMAITCDEGFIRVKFGKEFDGTRCEVRVSDASMKTDGLVLIEKLTAAAGYCINPGYYYIGCSGPTSFVVEYMDATVGNEYKVEHKLENAPYYKVLKLEQVEEHWTTVPESHEKPDFDKSYLRSPIHITFHRKTSGTRWDRFGGRCTDG